MIAWITKYRKVNSKPNSIQEETSETQFSLFDNQYWRKIILDFKGKIKAIKSYQIVSDLLRITFKGS